MPDVSRLRRHPALGTGTRRAHRASSRQPRVAALTKPQRCNFLNVCMNIVVVESPAKAKTINKYLGRDYKVVASYGHNPDLPAKAGFGLPSAGAATSS